MGQEVRQGQAPSDSKNPWWLQECACAAKISRGQTRTQKKGKRVKPYLARGGGRLVRLDLDRVLRNDTVGRTGCTLLFLGHRLVVV